MAPSVISGRTSRKGGFVFVIITNNFVPIAILLQLQHHFVFVVIGLGCHGIARLFIQYHPVSVGKNIGDS
jgi:hypothetical protein